MRGADALVKTLENAGTRYLFALSGNQIMPVFDAALDTSIEIVHVRHEAAAVHMADAWGRLNATAGIALVTAGPGHANGLSACYSALMSETPVVFMSGHAPVSRIGQGAFQEIDQAAMAAPVCKAAWVVQSAAEIAQDIARAIQIAESGRPGPVYLGLPGDVVNQTIPDGPGGKVIREADRPVDSERCREIRDFLATGQRPLIILGPLASRFAQEQGIDTLEAAFTAPIIATESPRGVNDPALGAYAQILAQADRILLVGKPLDFTLGFGNAPVIDANAKFMLVDPDASVIEQAKNNLGSAERFEAGIEGTPRALFAAMLAAPHAKSSQAQWQAEVKSAITYRPASWGAIKPSAEGPLHAYTLSQGIRAHLAQQDEVVLVLDGGECGQWAQANLTAATRITNGPSGAIGASLPYALGASYARPNASILAVMGDGTFGFQPAEMDTAVRYGINCTIVVCNDACWNAEHQIQIRDYGENRTVACELLPTRYDEVAKGFGAHAELVTHADELAGALKRASEHKGPSLINVSLERVPAPIVRRS